MLILGNGSCDFETDWCGWREHSNNNYSRWLRTVNEGTVPTLTWRGKYVDFIASPTTPGETLGTVHYLYLRGAPKRN